VSKTINFFSSKSDLKFTEKNEEEYVKWVGKREE
jgi:hypothetical protein